VQFFGTPLSPKPIVTPTVITPENKPVAEPVLTTTALDTIEPTVAVAIAQDTPAGQVLGTELPGFEQGTPVKNTYLKMFGILTVAILLIMLVYKTVIAYKKKN
jgi:hypothetical protein